MTLLGFSASAVKNGNVDRMVRAVLEKSAEPYEFVRLSELAYSPCRACPHQCAKDNLCTLDDDLKPYYPKILAADALVLGTPVYFDSMNGFMSVFLERLWSFRHCRFPLEGKPFVVVSTGDKQDAAELAIEAVKRRMIAYRASFVGSVSFGSTIFPCYTCGYGHRCKVGGFFERYGEEGIRTLKITPDLFKRWEDFPEIASGIDRLAEKISDR
ncbi:MAG: flavodoxin family protein [Desulfobacterales bacterium]|nr:flavodoxin family protein [Desulfobacterales bacterium]